MFAQVSEQNIFPTTIWTFDLPPDISEPLNVQALKDLNELTSPRPALRPGRNWQTDQCLHEYEEFASLIEHFHAASAQVLETLDVEHDGFEITGCWANMNPRNAFHVAHSHANNYLSGIYYVQAAPGANHVTFHDPRSQLEIIAPRLKQINRYTETATDVEVKAGRIVIFPSWLVHSVKSNQSDTIRISISFNIMFSSFTGTMSKPKWEGLPLTRKPKKEL